MAILNEEYDVVNLCCFVLFWGGGLQRNKDNSRRVLIWLAGDSLTQILETFYDVL